ncbi:MAG: exodeoxyribonuclease VII large subunit [Nitrospinae bacterium CG11_big_fil_rev_8_21_14_0_20_45_15]|nr:MAG: exodeoxyribonuclease VII large subunit [Nitrospinae bacterium CG11_big_fil_rev_8_21_14_0_20_45_15]
MPIPPGPKVYSVREFTDDTKAILEAAFDSVWIEGEISNLRTPASGHSYFILKDSAAQVRCVFFKGYRSGLKYKPEDGDHVLLFGRVTVYSARGEYQVIVESVEPHGLGALQKAFEQLKKKLSDEGLFDDVRKKTLPEFPWKVGVVTSSTGAAIRDIVNVIQRRNPKVSILLYPVKVQGDGAAEEIAQGIRTLNKIPDIDVLIVGRGGGSLEDLWAFNEEVVARAIAESQLPIVSAVGHEVDFTIADFCADLRAATPSAGAELVVPDLREIESRLRSLTRQAILNTMDKIRVNKEHLRHLTRRRVLQNPQEIFAFRAQRVDDLNRRLFNSLDHWSLLQRGKLEGWRHRLLQSSPQKTLAVQNERFASLSNRLKSASPARLIPQQRELAQALAKRLERLIKSSFKLVSERRKTVSTRLATQASRHLQVQRKRFEGAVKQLNALSPLAVLDRGYSICLHDGKAVLTSAKVAPGDSVTVRLSKGQLDCVVKETQN